MQIQTFKRTTIYISLGESVQVFRSPDEIPQPLRKRLVRSTRGMNSATILIADRGGREEIRKILEGEPSALKGRLRTEYFEKRREAAPNEAAEAPKRSWRRLAELSLPAALGAALWLLFTLK